uniref:NADH-ubiquinone oxidoreductase chain 2 n=1 Tax=Chamberlainia hainesiana TaxID=1264661 RepID=A0A513X0A3_9BIVA|nr:NADH dehydrogenase subunit 2 [Chamberlainia hainesiana]QDH07359.1 NADH dehydrogenase subunit 2 [Chamberlainia hainesiana]
MKSPHKFLFLSLMILSTCMVLSSSNWFMTWIGLEINMLGFIPLMFTNGTTSESETAVKYLVPQSLGSTIFITSAAASYYFDTIQILMPIAMFMKLGAAPFHFWFAPVMAGLSLQPAFILLTWQKIAPIFTINSMDQMLSLKTMAVAFISSLWGSVGGLNQTDIRMLLTYSSITHTGWMLASVSANAVTLMIYVVTYMMINLSLYICLVKNLTKSHKQLLTTTNPMNSLPLAIMILSLGGLPPLAGFIMKLLVLYHTKASLFIIMGLILGTLISLLFYLSLTLSPLMEFNKTQLPLLDKTPKHLITLLILQTLPLSLMLLLF